MSRAYITIEELFLMMEGNLIPEISGVTWPEWLSDNAAAVSEYAAAQLGPRVLLKKYDPDLSEVFTTWWNLQVKSFVAAHDFEFSKKHALLSAEYDFDADRVIHREGSEEDEAGKTETTTPNLETATTYEDDVVTHRERTYNSDTIKSITEDEHAGGPVVSQTGTHTVEHSGSDNKTYDEDITESRNPQDAIMAERRIAAFSLIIEIAERLVNSTTYAQWEV